MKNTIKNGLLTGGVFFASGGNQPGEYGDRERRFFERQTVRFAQDKAKYASDYFKAMAQGIMPDAPFEWTEIKLRMADAVRPSASITRNFDDYKNILIAEPPIDYVRPGTKIECMGNTWLAVNPANISSPIGNGIVRRCNAVWNYLDYYGNLHSEPIIVDKLRANANDSDDQESGLITKGWFNVTAQYNCATRQLNTNSRMILGSGAYRITGYSDFQTEFTGDRGSVRLLEFTIRYEEPNDVIDDLVNHVAGGKTFSWEISAAAKTVLRPGETAQITAESRRNGEAAESTEEHPVNYLYVSSDTEIISVDAQGLITAVSDGEAEVTVTLEENPAYSAKFGVTVEAAGAEDHVEFLGTVPDEIAAFQSAEFSAAYFENGEQTDAPVAWELSGAAEGTYSYETDENRITVRCWGGSVTPLTVTAFRNGSEAAKDIFLRGI